MVIILGSYENAVSHNYIVAKGSSILTTFETTMDIQEPS